jgi:hypothetical protein
MGARLAAYYTEAEALLGLDGKIQLAMLTRIPSTRALVEPDSADNVSRFEGAMSTIRRARPPANHQGWSSSGSLPPERVTASQRTLADGEELFWGVLGSLHDAVVCIFDLSARCLMVWESRSLERRYPAPDAYTKVGDSIARLVSARCAAEIRAVHEGGGSQHTEFSGSLHGYDVWLSVSLSAAHDAKGQVVGVHAFVQDITEKKQHEETLKRNEIRLREQARIYVELLARKTSLLDDVDGCLKRITEAAASTLDTARASVWFFGEERARLICADLFDGQGHEHGAELPAAEFSAYFAALCEGRALVVSDVRQDVRTSRLAEARLVPHGLAARLDVPIWVQGEAVGIVSFEHRAPHVWAADEESFACMMAGIVSLALQLGESGG